MANTSDSCNVADAGDPDVAGLGVRESRSSSLFEQFLTATLTGHHRIPSLNGRNSNSNRSSLPVGIRR